MELTTFLLDLLKFSLSGMIVVLCAFFLLKGHFDTYYNLRELEYKSAALKDILPLRLQALERMTLFVERINPANLFVRLHISGMSAREMQNLILTEVREEYQHNLAQQLYLSNDAWSVIKRVKDDTIGLINGAMKTIDDDASAVELSKAVFTRLESLEDSPYEIALQIIKRGVQDM